MWTAVSCVERTVFLWWHWGHTADNFPLVRTFFCLLNSVSQNRHFLIFSVLSQMAILVYISSKHSVCRTGCFTVEGREKSPLNRSCSFRKILKTMKANFQPVCAAVSDILVFSQEQRDPEMSSGGQLLWVFVPCCDPGPFLQQNPQRVEE